MKSLTAKDIMVPDVLTADKEWSVEYLSNFLIEHSITGAPVISADGTLEGVVSLTDIARNQKILTRKNAHEKPQYYYLDGELNQYSDDIKELMDIQSGDTAKVKDIMTPVVFSVSLDTPVKQVADAMIRGRIHRVLVTKGRMLLGIITTLDMLKIIHEYS